MQAYTVNNFADNCDFEKLSTLITDQLAWFKTDICHVSFRAIHIIHYMCVCSTVGIMAGKQTQYNIMFNNQPHQLHNTLLRALIK